MTNKQVKAKAMDKIYSADFIYHICEKLSYKFFGPLFAKLPFSHIEISVINLFTNGIAAVYLFSLGTYWGLLLGLLFCVNYSIFDWMDGFVAKSRGISSVLGGWLDPALDFVWQHFLVAAIALGVYNTKGQNYYWLLLGMFALVSLVIANHLGDIFRDKFDFRFRSSTTNFRTEIYRSKNSRWFDKLCVEILAPTNFFSLFFFTIRYPILLGALFNRIDITLIIIATTSTTKAVALFYAYSRYLLQKDGQSAKYQIIKALNKRAL